VSVDDMICIVGVGVDDGMIGKEQSADVDFALLARR